VGEPLDSFYNKEFCAKVPMQTARGEAVAPLAFGSAFAGFLLAHALAYPDEGEARQFRMDVFGGLGTPLRKSSLERKDCPYCGRCIPPGVRRTLAIRGGVARGQTASRTTAE
jgi:hypothetical protein